MAYQKLNWLNKGETGAIPINKTNLNHMDNGIADLYDAIFPIGQIIIKGDDADYSNWLGFTWERTAVGKVLVGYDSTDTDFNTIGKTGGEKKHTLTVDEMPAHNHNLNAFTSGSGSTGRFTGTYEWSSTSSDTESTRWIGNTVDVGGGQAHNNLQPYQVVAYWKRTA